VASKYEIISGKFFCHTCENTANTARLYGDTKTLTWLCTAKHMSQVELKTEKKTKKDYERER
jgi:hypothetical protein